MVDDWGHQLEAFPCLACMWWSCHTVAVWVAFIATWLELQWDSSCWSFLEGYDQFQWWISFHTSMCGTSHSQIQWLGVLSQCLHSRFLVSVKDLLTNAIGWLSWMMHAPSPLRDVSHCNVTGLFNTWVISVNRDLIIWKLSWSSHPKWLFSFFRIDFKWSQWMT